MSKTCNERKNEDFWREFIEMYQSFPVLWNPNHSNYRNRVVRTEAIAKLVVKCKECYSEADEDFVRRKIDTIRSSFRKELRKVEVSKRETPEDVYKPSLWYFDLMLFLVGKAKTDDRENPPPMEESHQDLVPKDPFWKKEHVGYLIELYKKQPCLYVISHVYHRSHRRRREAIRRITQGLNSVTGKYYHVEDVRKKILQIRNQFLYEFRKHKLMEQKEEEYESNLWYYELMTFLAKQYNSEAKKVAPKPHEETNPEPETILICQTIDHDMVAPNGVDNQTVIPKNDCSDDNNDIFDTIAKNVAHQLRGMTAPQRHIAEKIVKDAMYHGQMENLTSNSRLSLDGL